MSSSSPLEAPAAPASPPAPARRRARPGRQRLGRFLLKRIAAGLLLCVGITLVSFLLTQLVPGDPVTANLGQQASADPAAVAAFRHQYGLDRPVPVQYLVYLGNVLHGDFGMSQQSHRPVSTDLAEYIPATMELALFAIVVSIVIGVPLGILAAVYRDRWVDQVLRVVSLAGVSMPTFWIALLAFYLLFFKLGVLPGGGRLDPTETPPTHTTGFYTVDALLHGQWSLLGSALLHLVLPGLVLATYTVGMLLRFTRASVLEILGLDYVRAARAKGLPERVVVLRHVLRPALISIITVAGVAFGSLLSGTVLVESIFSWPGLGQYAYNSAKNLDLPAIMGVSVVVAVVYIVINLLVDVLYGVIDPRIRLS
ncbi:ABC transporter permease [Nakamurella endophytica]|uniref:Peptide ABC transporter permease n=1 Tax=Nakamurella endophytica TaxID=1748367 RepID=A0A917T8W3_9ACTN|nr:ABC transporter permease [Nakamurella endophytica]GGM13978.1 peptide ABC transporter permease [Nakamurella endophytica]